MGIIYGLALETKRIWHEVQAAGADSTFQSQTTVATIFMPTNMAFDTAAKAAGMNFTSFLRQKQAVSQVVAIAGPFLAAIPDASCCAYSFASIFSPQKVCG